MIRLTRPKESKFRVRLNWRAYFEQFCEVHGGDPVEHRGRLLFRNGWTHSSTDYAGPEWEPPEDPRELQKLRVAYWAKRRSMVKHELFGLQIQLGGLQALAKEKCCPLKQVVAALDEHGNETNRVETRLLDLSRLRGRIGWLEADLKECGEQLRALVGQPGKVLGTSKEAAT